MGKAEVGISGDVGWFVRYATGHEQLIGESDLGTRLPG